MGRSGKASSAPWGLLLLVVLVCVSLGMRQWLAVPASPPLELAARAVLAGDRVELNEATAATLADVPGISPDLALRIVGDREQHGAYADVVDVLRVKGVGGGDLRALAAWVTVNGRSHPIGDELAAAADRARWPRKPPPAAIDCNEADAVAFDGLPWIGPATAERIVADREARGPFPDVASLARVRGIGPATVERLRGRVNCGPGEKARAPPVRDELEVAGGV